VRKYLDNFGRVGYLIDNESFAAFDFQDAMLEKTDNDVVDTNRCKEQCYVNDAAQKSAILWLSPIFP